jgi:predicted acetyltransferase
MLTLTEKHNDGNTLWYSFSVGDTIVGKCQIKLVSHDGNSLYYEVFPEHRGKGYGAELLKQSLQEMRTLGIKQASILCEPENTASLNLLTKELGVGRTIRQFIFNN